jgi:hypothetical protein
VRQTLGNSEVGLFILMQMTMCAGTWTAMAIGWHTVAGL